MCRPAGENFSAFQRRIEGKPVTIPVLRHLASQRYILRASLRLKFFHGLLDERGSIERRPQHERSRLDPCGPRHHCYVHRFHVVPADRVRARVTVNNRNATAADQIQSITGPRGAGWCSIALACNRRYLQLWSGAA
jgi:hypothetical protein